jgi:hypothetical protein
MVARGAEHEKRRPDVAHGNHAPVHREVPRHERRFA